MANFTNYTNFNDYIIRVIRKIRHNSCKIRLKIAFILRGPFLNKNTFTIKKHVK
jgi:hypothetical protein